MALQRRFFCASLLSLAVIFVPALSRAQQPVRPEVRLVQPERPAGSRQVTLDRVFELTSEFGDRDVFELTLGGPGRIRVEATWRGSVERLAVILNGPGQAGHFVRQDGTSPVSLTFDVTRELFARGNRWTVSVVNFSRTGRAVGRVRIEHPSSPLAIAALPLSVRRVREAAVAKAPTAPDQPERSILPDGRVQVRHPDGRVVIYEPQCGFTTIFPDGSTTTVMCNQVQPATLPALPSDPALRSFLETHRDHLLQHISQLVDHRQSEVDLYLRYESEHASGLFEQIRMRTRFIDNLLR